MLKATMQLSRGVRAWTAILAVALVGSALFAASAQALPATFWGAVPQETPTPEQFQRLKGGGVDSVRIPIEWGGVQQAPGGPINWSGPDGVIGRAATAGVEVLPFLTGAPSWAVPTVFVPGTGKTSKAPARLPASGPAAGAWSNFLKAAVARYGPNGSFWAEHPEVPKRPIRAWQIWNEANFKYFVANPNPAEYGKLVKLSYTALKSADPAAQLVLGGLFALPKGCRSKAKPKRVYCATDFLDAMYEKTPGVKTKFNAVALHPYSYFYPELTPRIEEFRQVLKANGDAAKGLWITELGWSSQPPTQTNLFAKGLGGQATQLRGAFTLLERKQVAWKLKRVYWFSVDDQSGVCNFCDGSGLFAQGFVPKKSWFEFVKFAGGTP
jgi:Glycosyl hydrolase catalytic core